MIEGKKIIVLATDGFEDSELKKPVEMLKNAGADVKVVSLESGEIEGKNGTKVSVDATLSSVNIADFDALVLPGGVVNPDALRMDESAVKFVKDFHATGKTTAAICHAPWLLIEAGATSGKTITSWPSLKTDLENSGANWVDQQVAIDGNIITSRNPDDIPAFSQAIIDALN